MKLHEILYTAGRENALRLRSEAKDLTGTQIIAREDDAPAFDPGRDYSAWPKGSPVSDGGQVWLLEIPHNAAHHPGLRPGDNRACWGLAHTTDPNRAKPWVAPSGTSGLYREDECCTWEGKVWRNLFEGNAYPPQTQGAQDRWEVVW